MILFLGSGVSLKSGLPSVPGIRAELLKPENHQGDCDPRLLEFFKVLFELDTRYLDESAPFKTRSGTFGFTGQLFRSATTYEDLFYLARQITLNGEGRRADITAEAFSDLVRRKCRSFLKGRSRLEQAIDLYRLADEAAKFIEATVSDLLHSTEVVGLDLVAELAAPQRVAELNIVTLNHDALVEQLLTARGIAFTDGFGDRDGDVRWFEDDFQDNARVRLVKLHGSVTWRYQGAGRVLQPVALDAQPHELKDRHGELIKDVNATPSILTGMNKVFSYSRAVFADQHYCFQKLLRSNSDMIMSGYGWGDAPINFLLQNWFARSDANRLILLHRDPEGLATGSLELMHIYNKYKTNGQIVPIEKWLSDTSLSEVENCLGT